MDTEVLMANNDWKLCKDELPATHDRAVAIYPPFKGREFACWNEHDGCWDTEYGDDYLCDREKVIAWFEIPPVPEEIKQLLRSST